MQNIIKSFFCIALLLLTLSGCDKKIEKSDTIKETPSELYNKALRHAKNNDHEKAIEHLDKIDQYYNHSNITERSYVAKAYIYYRMKKYQDSLDAIADYQSLYRGAKHASVYMEYLKGMCYYMRIGDPDRSQEYAQEALLVFSDLSRRYPNTKYGKKALENEKVIFEILAAKEMNIGRFYLQSKNPIAAIGRFQFVNIVYPKSKSRAEALYRIAECYTSVNIPVKAKIYVDILNKEYPNNEWTKRGNELKSVKVQS